MNLFIIVVALALLWISFRSLFQPGMALGLMWSSYSAEQLCQQGNSFFVEIGSSLNFAFAGVMLLSILNALRTGRLRRLKLPPELFWCLALYLFAALSWAWSVSPYDTMQNLKAKAPYVFVFALAMPFCATDQKQLRLAINTSVFLGALILVGHALGGYGRRSLILSYADGFTKESNPLAIASHAGYVAICALFSIYGRKYSPMVALKASIFVLGALVIIKSGSRGQLIFLAVACFVWLPIVARATLKRSTVISLLLAIVIVGGVIYAMYELRDTGRWQVKHFESGSKGRVEMIMGLLSYWFDKGAGAWFFGLGSSSSFGVIGFYPHNVPVEVMAEEGLIGLFIYVGFCVCVIFRAGKIMFLSALKQESRVNLGVLLALFCFEGLLTLKQGSLLGSSMWVGFGITIGVVANRFLNVAKQKNSTNRFLQNQQLWHGQMQHNRFGQSS